MAKTAQAHRDKIIAHVLAELSAGVPISRTLGPDRKPWLCSERCFWNWYYESDADAENGLVQKVARARDSGVEAMVDKAIVVAETPQIGEIVSEEETNIGGVKVPVTKVRKEDMLGHRKLVVETYFKAAQMLKPKTYGAKLDLTSGGERITLSGEIEAARARTAKGE